MGSTARHIFDTTLNGQIDILTIAVISLYMFVLFIYSKGLKLSTKISILAVTLLVADLPYEQSLMKREGVLKPIFMATLGREEL